MSMYAPILAKYIYEDYFEEKKMTNETLDDKTFFRIQKFLEQNPRYRINGPFPYDTVTFEVKTHEAACKVYFEPDLIIGRQLVFNTDRDYDYFFNQLIADVNEANESELEEATKAIPFSNESLKIAQLEKAIANLTQGEGKETQLFSRKIVLHFSHGDRRYEAQWNDTNEFSLCLNISPDPDNAYYWCVGKVRVQKDPSWDNDTFVSVSKIAINAFLDGMRSGSALF